MMKAKRYIAVVLLISLAFWPGSVGAAGWELKVFQWGPLEVALEAGVKVGIRSSLIGRLFSGLMLADAILGFFSARPVSAGTQYSSGSVGSGDGADASPTVTASGSSQPFTVSIDPHQVMDGRVFSIKFGHLIFDEKIHLTGGGYLTVEPDGRLVFHNFGFEGHMLYHYDKVLSVWKSGLDQPLLVFRLGRDDRLEVLQEQGEEASKLLRKLLGG